MLNRFASLAMSTSVLKAFPSKLDIKRHSISTLYIYVTHKKFLIICRPIEDVKQILKIVKITLGKGSKPMAEESKHILVDLKKTKVLDWKVQPTVNY